MIVLLHQKQNSPKLLFDDQNHDFMTKLMFQNSPDDHIGDLPILKKTKELVTISV